MKPLSSARCAGSVTRTSSSTRRSRFRCMRSALPSQTSPAAAPSSPVPNSYTRECSRNLPSALHWQPRRHPPDPAGHPDHEELVQAAGEDGHEPHSLQQRDGLVLRQFQYSLVEPEPALVAFQVTVGGSLPLPAPPGLSAGTGFVPVPPSGTWPGGGRYRPCPLLPAPPAVPGHGPTPHPHSSCSRRDLMWPDLNPCPYRPRCAAVKDPRSTRLNGMR